MVWCNSNKIEPVSLYQDGTAHAINDGACEYTKAKGLAAIIQVDG
jgi:hypothetical protein